MLASHKFFNTVNVFNMIAFILREDYYIINIAYSTCMFA